MKEKVSLERAKEVAESLRKKYKHGKPGSPKWFGNSCVHMEQDGSYGVSICIPSWNSMTQEDRDELYDPYEGMHIGLRVVIPAKPYIPKKESDDTAEDKGTKDGKKKKRGSTGKGDR